MAQWPAELPQGFQVDSLSATFEPTYSTFKPEIGRPIRRSISTRTFELIQGTMKFKNNQYTIFWNFWRVTLQRGVLSFDFPHPVLETMVEVEFAGEDPPTMAVVPGSYNVWQAQIQLRVLDET